MKTLTSILSLVLLIDVLGFCLWTMSGQLPVDNFYVGIITKTIISLII